MSIDHVDATKHDRAACCAGLYSNALEGQRQEFTQHEAQALLSKIPS
jgi:hypothetical protein